MPRHNSGGWKGSYCKTDTGCSGPVHELWTWVVREAGARQNLIQTFYGGPLSRYPDAGFPEPVFDQLHRVNAASGSAFTACAYATGLGYVDICSGAFTRNPTRELISDFIPIYSEPIYLISKLREDREDFWDYVAKAFRPFRGDLWAAIIGFLVFVSILTTFLESRHDGMYNGSSVFSALTHSLYRSAASIVDSGHIFIVTSPSSRWSQLGLGFFVLLATSAYTANLATYLILQDSAQADITEWAQVLADDGVKVCSVWALASILKGSLKLPEDQHVPLLSRGDVTTSIGTSTCKVGVMAQEDLEKAQQGGNFCSLVKVGEPLHVTEWAVPVSRRVASTFRYINVNAKAQGVWNAYLASSKPPPSCSWRSTQELEGSLVLG